MATKNLKCPYCPSTYKCGGRSCNNCRGCPYAHLGGACTCDDYVADSSFDYGPMTMNVNEFTHFHTTDSPRSSSQTRRTFRGETYTTKTGEVYEVGRPVQSLPPHSTSKGVRLAPAMHYADGVGYVQQHQPAFTVRQMAHIEGGWVPTGLWDPCGAELGMPGRDMDRKMNNPNADMVYLNPSATPRFALEHMDGVPVSEIIKGRDVGPCYTGAVVAGNRVYGGGTSMSIGHLGESHGYNADEWDGIELIDTPENKRAAEWFYGNM